jgi:hypothetical protein
VLTGIPVRRDVAMTGEITLRGRVLPIGGLKEKLLAALRGGIKTVLIPEDNAKDLAEIPDNVKNGLEIVPVILDRRKPMLRDGRATLLAITTTVLVVLLTGWLTKPTIVRIAQYETTTSQTEAVDVDHVAVQIAELLAQQQSAHWGFFTLIITGVGLIALFATLIETQQVGIHTRRIGEAQVRAYLGCEEAYLSLRPDRTLEAVLEFKNFGQSPALVLWANAEIFIYSEMDGRSDMEKHESPAGSEPSTLSAGQQEARRIRWHICEADGFLPDWVNVDFLRSHAVTIQVYAKWVDVFDQKQSMTFTFRSETDRHHVVQDEGVSVTKFSLRKFQEGMSLPSELG